MSTEIKLFENENFGKVRVIMKEDNDPWFVAKDVCECLGIDTAHGIRALDADEKGHHTMETPGGTQQLSIISESGLYSCVLRSRKPEAKEFKRWVTHEVLPSIRKTGSYSISNLPQLEELTSLVKTIAIQNNQLVLENKEIKEQLQAMEPKVRFYNTVSETDKVYDMNKVAKSINKCGRNQLFKILRDKRILMKNNIPYQRYVNLGLFKTIVDKNNLYVKTVVTGKGMQFIENLLQ